MRSKRCAPALYLTDRIESSFVKRVAFQETPQTHPDPPSHAVFLNGLQHVLRTRRMKTARRRQTRRHPPLIDTKNGQRQGPHFSITRPKARSIAAKLASSAARRGLSTMSHCAPNSARCNRNAARRRRLIRFRNHCFADRFRHGEPQPSALKAGLLLFRFGPLPAEGGEQRTGNSKAMVIGGAKLSRAQDPGRSRES